MRERIPLLTFAMVTIVSTIALIYSFSAYFGAYTALRMFDVSIPDFNVIEFNATQIHIETILALDNPASQEFQALYFEQRIYLNGEFFTFTRPEEPKERNPMRIAPRSSTNMTIDTEVPQTKIELYRETQEQSWFTSVLVVLEGPIIGRYWLTISRQIPTS